MKKACNKDKMLVEGPTCPLCKGNQFTESWKGRIVMFNVEKSDIAKKLEIKVKGEYAIKI